MTILEWWIAIGYAIGAAIAVRGAWKGAAAVGAPFAVRLVVVVLMAPFAVALWPLVALFSKEPKKPTQMIVGNDGRIEWLN